MVASRLPNKNIIVLHDCLETKLGEVKVNQGTKLFKGHNGLKSIGYELGDTTTFTRIAIGIGRPVERDPASVRNYVLGPFTESEQKEMELKQTVQSVYRAI